MENQKNCDEQAINLMFKTKTSIKRLVDDVFYNLVWDDGDTFIQVMSQFLYDLESLACEKIATDILEIQLGSYYETHSRQMDLDELKPLIDTANNQE